MKTLALLLLLGSGCSLHTTRLSVDTVAVGRRASAVATVYKAGDATALEVEVYDIRSLNRIRPDGDALVVWLRSPQGVPRNVGTLRLQIMPERLNQYGFLRTTVPEHAFDLFITAEKRADATQPTANQVVWATVARAD